MKKKNLIVSSALATVLGMSTMMMTPLSAISDDAGVTVTRNTDHPEWKAKYLAKFVYEDEDARDATSVNVQGGFQYYKESETGGYEASGDNSGIPCYDAFEYEEGMYAASSSLETGGMIPYEMVETSPERFEVTIPVPANQYFYAYYVQYDGDTDPEHIVKTIDPANKPISYKGKDAGWSLMYVGDSGETKGQEYAYPRTDGKTGTVSFVDYDAVDGTKQPLGVYVPYGYDSSKTYKTIYVSHGGGGNAVEWMTIGSAGNIMDNVIANGEMAEAIVVTMDNAYFEWDYEAIKNNLVNHIIPFVEANYSVSKEANDRAFCGLSMGSMTTNQMAKMIPDEFGYFGSFSGGTTDLDATHYDVNKLNQKTLYLTAGTIDMAYNNTMGISSVDFMDMYDELGVKYDFELKLGAHDWYVWRDSLTTFAKDYLWNPESAKPAPATPATPANKTSTSVKTGDETNILGFAMLSMLTLSGLVVLKKKYN